MIKVPLLRRTTAASSAPLWSKMTDECGLTLRLPSTWARSLGPILHAQPEPWLRVVSLTFSLSFIVSIPGLTLSLIFC